MKRYPIHMNYNLNELPIGLVELKDDIPNYALVNGAIVPMVRLTRSNPDESELINFGLVLRKAVEVSRPYVGSPSVEKSNLVTAISREDDDPVAETRISLGTPKTGYPTNDFYLVFRGDPEQVIDVLERALSIAKVELPAGEYKDNRTIN